MTETMTAPGYATLPHPTTLRIERFLPGPIERVWAYLTESDLRRQWLAAGEMEGKVGGRFDFVWRNDTLTSPPGRRPEGFGAEHRMEGTVTAWDPPHRLAITWGQTDGITFELSPLNDRIRLVIIHKGIAERPMRLNISAGWHAHLDMLAARASGAEPAVAFWDRWSALKADYDGRLPA